MRLIEQADRSHLPGRVQLQERVADGGDAVHRGEVVLVGGEAVGAPAAVSITQREQSPAMRDRPLTPFRNATMLNGCERDLEGLGTSSRRPGPSLAQKWRMPGTITLTTGKPMSGRVCSRISMSMPCRGVDRRRVPRTRRRHHRSRRCRRTWPIGWIRRCGRSIRSSGVPRSSGIPNSPHVCRFVGPYGSGLPIAPDVLVDAGQVGRHVTKSGLKSFEHLAGIDRVVFVHQPVP